MNVDATERPRTAATDATAASPDASRAGRPTVLDAIRDAGGFRAYVEDMEKEKIARMREEILARMGLSEDDLNDMTADARAAVEDMIAHEIQSRMAGRKAAEDDRALSPMDATMIGLGIGPGSRGAGLGPLLALQEGPRGDGGDPLEAGQDLPGRPEKEEK